MRDDICTIPISEAFEDDGCPFCTMEQRITKRLTEYIIGPAMMEPDIREMTNKSGFCRNHFEEMLKMKNRLSLALMIQTYLTHGAGNDTSKKASQDSCFVCKNLAEGMSAMIRNFFTRYAKDNEMKELFLNSGYICRPHFLRLRADSKKLLSAKHRKDFDLASEQLYKKSLDGVLCDINAFAKSFDYRNSGKKNSGAENAVEDAIRFIVGAE